ncbi:MAG: hypothetical protein ACPG06_01395 [Alphaproteobacteria bacterium]
MNKLYTLISATLILWVVTLQAPPAMADDHRVPLNQIVDRIHEDRGGVFLGARYNEERDRYRIVWKQRNGNVTSYVADPDTGAYRRAPQKKRRK